jgi:hypothetical protein
MQQKVLAGILSGIICILFVLGAGCTSLKEGTPVPTAPTQAATGTQTVVATPVTTLPISSKVIATEMLQSNDTLLDRDGTLARDAAFDALFAKSVVEIVNKTGLVLEAMIPGSTSAQLVYSPAVLYLRAEDPGFTTENYSNEMLKTNTTTPENEAKRIAFIQFLYSAKNAAYHIADVAEAESFGDYQNAQAYLQLAKGDLRNIKVNPALPPTIRQVMAPTAEAWSRHRAVSYPRARKWQNAP